ncbi:hypothetical protein WN51_10520 [Melipona quadrifasciata]|uniref:Uncharacterized protein n=1 Tax=Melipona quadrifasciata TaxID=166423 RepID=A0A0N0BIG9_9HYME|nr:hypothetical protein WN51_10520 [Melipona quadrifasciata]
MAPKEAAARGGTTPPPSGPLPKNLNKRSKISLNRESKTGLVKLCPATNLLQANDKLDRNEILDKLALCLPADAKTSRSVLVRGEQETGKTKALIQDNEATGKVAWLAVDEEESPAVESLDGFWYKATTSRGMDPETRQPLVTGCLGSVVELRQLISYKAIINVDVESVGDAARAAGENALDEEQRAQKALYLLRARDRRIAFLEKRVAELEDVAGNLHEEVTLRNSSRSSILEGGGEAVVSDFSRSERSSRTGNCYDTGERSNCNLEDVDSTRFDDVGSSRGVPTLRLSPSSSSRDISSTAIDLLLEKRKRFASDVEDAARKDPDPDRKSVTKAETADSEKFVDVDERSNREGCLGRDGDEIRKGECLTVSVGKGSSCDKRRGSSFPRMSSSVPWIRARHGFRKKLRGCELKNGKRMKELSSGDGQTLATFRRDRSVPDNATPTRESRDPNQPIANFRCISVAPEDPIFWIIPAKITVSDKML